MRGAWVRVVAGVGVAALVLGLCVDSVRRWSDEDEPSKALASPQPTPTPTPTDLHGTVVRLDAATGERLSVIPVGQEPSLLTVASAHPWTMNFGDGSLSRIDPETDTAVTIDVGEVAGMASDGADIWVAVDGRRIMKLDGSTGERELSFEVAPRKIFELGDAGFLTTDGSDIWLTVPRLGRRLADQSLWRIDASTGKLLDRVGIGSDPPPPLVDGRNIWIATFSRGLSRIDWTSEREELVTVGPRPWGLAKGSGSIWVGDEEGGVWRVEAATARVRDLLPTGAGVRGLAVGGGRVWAATESGVVAFDPATNGIVHDIELMDPLPDLGPFGIAHASGDVWVSVN